MTNDKTVFCAGCSQDVPAALQHNCPSPPRASRPFAMTLRASARQPSSGGTQRQAGDTNAATVRQAIEAAIRDRKIPPGRREAYMLAALDGRDVVADLEQLTPAPADVAAGWSRQAPGEQRAAPLEAAVDPEFAGLFPPARDGVTVDPEFAHLFPTTEAAAQQAEEDAYRTLFGQD